MLSLLVLLLVYVLVVVVANRFQTPAKTVVYLKSNETGGELKALEIVSWNLGYAGLGKDANFVADGGKDLLPESRQIVVGNTAGIIETLDRFSPHIFFLQEVAGPSFVNRNVDLRREVEDSKKGFKSIYSPDIKTSLVPYPLNMDTGKLTLSVLPIIRAEGILLPLEDIFYAGIVKRQYRMLVTRFDVGNDRELVAINVHLAAFDDGATRQKQVEAVIQFAENEFSNGCYVIVGGDWNLRLVNTDFPHTTDDKFLFWLADFPMDVLPTDWELAADGSVPSVRTVHKKYDKGDNYVCTVDGFLLSPNVRLIDVRNVDLGFENSDHQPVKLTVNLEEADNSAENE